MLSWESDRILLQVEPGGALISGTLWQRISTLERGVDASVCEVDEQDMIIKPQYMGSLFSGLGVVQELSRRSTGKPKDPGAFRRVPFGDLFNRLKGGWSYVIHLTSSAI